MFFSPQAWGCEKYDRHCTRIQSNTKVFAFRKLAQPLSIVEASQIISDLGLWRVHQPQVEDILSAIQIQQRYQLSFWDSMIVRSATQLGCSIIWTEELNAGQLIEGCKIQTPFDHERITRK